MGGGSSWSMVKGHIARHTDEDQRPLVVAGLRLQMILISLSRVLYPLLDLAIRKVFQFEEELPRYRAAVMTCMTFCWIGIAAIIICRPALPVAAIAGVKTAGSEKPKLTKRTEDESNLRVLGSRKDGPLHGKMQLAMLIVSIIASACSLTAVSTLWPMLLKARFRWGPREFAYVSAGESLATASALIGYPRAAVIFGGGLSGGVKVAEILATVAACMVFVAYCLATLTESLSDIAAVSLHVMPALIASASLGALGPCLETVASLHLSAEMQGVAMGALNGAFSVGGLIGPVLGTALWTASSRHGTLILFADGRLPYVIVAGILLVIAISLKFCLAMDSSGIEEHVANDCVVEPEIIGCEHDAGTAKVNEKEIDESDSPLSEDGPELAGLLNRRDATIVGTALPSDV